MVREGILVGGVMRGIFLLMGLILIYCAEAAAGRAAKNSIEERTFGANQIAHGMVLSAQHETFRNQYGDELTVTRAKIQVKEMLKGEPAEQIEMIVEKRSNGSPVSEGDEIVVFLEETPDGLEPHQGGNGIMKLVTNTKRVRNSTLTVDSIREKIRKANLWQQAF
jgi:hypothetical protein